MYVVCLYIWMCMHMDVCMCVSVCVCMCGVCVWESRKREKKSLILPYRGSMIILLNVSFFFFSFSTMLKAQFWMCYLKEMDFSPLFLRAILKEACFSGVSSQNDKPAKYICIILGMFYWKYPLHVEFHLIFFDLQKSQGPNYILQVFLLLLCKILGFISSASVVQGY